MITKAESKANEKIVFMTQQAGKQEVIIVSQICEIYA
jgi:hypothetical protein